MSQALEKGIELLDHVAKGADSLSALSRTSGIPKSTVHRLVATLLRHNLLSQDGHRYRLGSKLLELSERLKQQVSVLKVARKYLEETSRKTGEVVHLGELDDQDLVYLDKVSGTRQLQIASRIGLRLNPQTTAMGKVLIAHLPSEQWERYTDDIEPRTPRSITDAKAFRAELATVRAQGYAVDHEENELGVCCVAAPVWNETGKVIAAVSITGATIYFSDTRISELIPEVLTCSYNISRDLGGREFARPMLVNTE